MFTLPAELRPLSAFVPRVLYEALFQAAERTLIEFAARNLDATIGATLVLHTWTRDLAFHPHVHAIVTGGGLARDGTAFRKRSRSFLFPVTAMALVFRAKLLDLLWQAHRRGDFLHFDDFQDPEGFASLINRLPKKWHCYAKPVVRQRPRRDAVPRPLHPPRRHRQQPPAATDRLQAALTRSSARARLN